MSWHEIQLGDALRVKHGFAFKGEYFSDSGKFMVLTPGNFFEKGGFRVREGKERFYTGEIPEEYFLKAGDLIVAMTEQGEGLLGSAARIPESERYLHNQRLGLIRISDPDLLDTAFLYWLFNSPSVRAQIRSTATGAKVKHTAPERIYKVKVAVPTVSEQKAIALILDSYDALISANQRRIQLLEESARLLYREWFVHLRFPGYVAVPVTDGVPEGWRSEPFSSSADFINGFAFKPSHQLAEGLPIVKIPELRDGVSNKTPCNPGIDIPTRNKIDTGDLLFSWSATLLVNEWSEGPALLNQHLFKVIPKTAEQKRLIRFALEDAIPRLLGHSVGATMQHIRRGVLDEQHLLIPDAETSRHFASLVDPFIDEALTLQAVNRGLVKAIDLLLPKLMSGALDASRIAIPKEATA